MNKNYFQAEARAEFAEKTVKKLQKEVDRLEGILKFTFCLVWNRIIRVLILRNSCSLLNGFSITLVHHICNIFVTDTLFREKEKTKAICDDLDSTFAELTGY